MINIYFTWLLYDVSIIDDKTSNDKVVIKYLIQKVKTNGYT